MSAPEFVRRAVDAGYSAEAAAALYRKIAQTRADIHARRITPAGGMRRVERMALVVAVVGIVGCGPPKGPCFESAEIITPQLAVRECAPGAHAETTPLGCERILFKCVCGEPRTDGGAK